MKFKLSIILSVLTGSCSTYPPDVPVCEHLGRFIEKDSSGHDILKPSPACMKAIEEPECGHCTYIVSGKEIYVGEYKKFNKKTWSQIKSEAIVLPAEESYAPIAAYMINACKKMNCSKDINRFKVQLGTLKNSRNVVE
jgi:hypothetical protein